MLLLSIIARGHVLAKTHLVLGQKFSHIIYGVFRSVACDTRIMILFCFFVLKILKLFLLMHLFYIYDFYLQLNFFIYI
jgi:hypothetical protein